MINGRIYEVFENNIKGHRKYLKSKSLEIILLCLVDFEKMYEDCKTKRKQS